MTDGSPAKQRPSTLRKVLREFTTSMRMFGRVFANADVRRVQLAFAGFNMAEWATWIAILVFAYRQSGAAFVGVVALLQLIPAAIFAPFASVLGDRHPRDRMLALAYALMALAMAATAACMRLHLSPPVVYVFAACTATVLAMVRPLHRSLLPSLVRVPSELTANNVASSTIESVSLLIGPAIAAFLLGTSGPWMVFAVMAGVMVVSTILALRVHVHAPAEPSEGGETALVREAFGGFAALRQDSRARLLIGLLGGDGLLLGALDVLFVVIAIQLLGLGESGAGLLNSAAGAGALFGSGLTVLLIGRKRLHNAFRTGTLVYGAPLVVIGAFPSPFVAPVMLGASAAGRSVMEVTGMTMLQRIVPDETLARVFGVLESMAMAANGIGAALASVLIALLGIRPALVVLGLMLPAAGLVVRRRIEDVDVGMQVPMERVELLLRNPIFSPLPAPTLESIAADLVEVDAPQGSTVIRQGDPGDNFYLIESGTAQVLVDDREVATLGSAEGFGEIALLRNVPRSATVKAFTPLHLLSLGRDHFLAAVTGVPASSAAADEVVRGRLADREEPEEPR